MNLSLQYDETEIVFCTKQLNASLPLKKKPPAQNVIKRWYGEEDAADDQCQISHEKCFKRFSWKSNGQKWSDFILL